MQPVLVWMIMLGSTWLAVAQSEATCQQGYEWSYAIKTPCELASQIFATCTAGQSYTVHPLKEGNHYDPPVGDTVNSCSCSWAAYNLMSMCTACQNSDSIYSWETYSEQCGKYESTSLYFPMDRPIVGNPDLPDYAKRNPQEWTNHLFNIAQAQNFTGIGSSPTPSKSKIPPTNTSSSSPSPHINIGAMIGSILGGTALLLALTIITVILKLRRATVHPHDTESGVYLIYNGSNRTSRGSSMTRISGSRRYSHIEPYTYTPSVPPPSPASGRPKSIPTPSPVSSDRGYETLFLPERNTPLPRPPTRSRTLSVIREHSPEARRSDEPPPYSEIGYQPGSSMNRRITLPAAAHVRRTSYHYGTY